MYDFLTKCIPTHTRTILEYADEVLRTIIELIVIEGEGNPMGHDILVL